VGERGCHSGCKLLISRRLYYLLKGFSVNGGSVFAFYVAGFVLGNTVGFRPRWLKEIWLGGGVGRRTERSDRIALAFGKRKQD
jgi:hypothetical protein